MSTNIAQDLSNLIEGEVKNDKETIKKYSNDASLFEVTPKVVTFPKHAEDIKKLVKYAAEHADENVSVTARSGGTDMSGGPLNESIIIDVNKHLNKVISVDESFAITQPGVFYRDFEKATLKKNLIIPSYPASREICTIGGMVANNSGGEKTLSYGQTKNFVTEIKAILRDGEEHTFKALTMPELEQKKQEPGIEGEIYQSMHKLIDENYDLIQSMKPKVSKNSSGYFLWDVWNKENNTFDLTKLLVGSQGTLGIFTESTIRLITPKKHSRMMVILLKDLGQLGEIIQRVLTFHPESFESYDDHTLRIAMRFLPDLLKQMKTKNLLSLIMQFLPEMGMIITGGVPKLILLAEFTGDDKLEVVSRATAAEAALKQFKIKTRILKTQEEAEKYWTMRRESFSLLRHHVHNKRTAPFIDDIIVNPDRLSDFLPRLNEIMSHYDITYTIAGHAGNGNFHIIPLMNVHRPDFIKIIKELSEKVYDLVAEFKGSITAEHNDGLIRTPFLNKIYSPEAIKLFEETKKIFDPDNIFNPGKKVSASWEYAIKHIVHD